MSKNYVFDVQWRNKVRADWTWAIPHIDCYGNPGFTALHCIPVLEKCEEVMLSKSSSAEQRAAAKAVFVTIMADGDDEYFNNLIHMANGVTSIFGVRIGRIFSSLNELMFAVTKLLPCGLGDRKLEQSPEFAKMWADDLARKSAR